MKSFNCDEISGAAVDRSINDAASADLSLTQRYKYTRLSRCFCLPETDIDVVRRENEGPTDNDPDINVFVV